MSGEYVEFFLDNINKLEKLEESDVFDLIEGVETLSDVGMGQIPKRDNQKGEIQRSTYHVIF